MLAPGFTTTVKLQQVQSSSGKIALKAGEHWLESPHDPELEAHQLIPKRPALPIIVGAGSGYLRRRLLQLGAIESVIVYEPSKSMRTALGQLSLASYVSCRVVHDLEIVRREILCAEFDPEIIITDGYLAAFASEYAHLLRIIELRFEMRGDGSERPESRSKYVFNFAQNFSRVRTTLRATAIGQPLRRKTVFVGFGDAPTPMTLRLLPELARRGAVFAPANEAWLTAHEHIHVAIASARYPGPENQHSLVSVIVADLAGEPRDFELGERALVAYHNYPFLRGFGTRTIRWLPHGLNPSVQAIELARLWGAERIVVLGRRTALGLSPQEFSVIAAGAVGDPQTTVSYLDASIAHLPTGESEESLLAMPESDVRGELKRTLDACDVVHDHLLDRVVGPVHSKFRQFEEFVDSPQAKSDPESTWKTLCESQRSGYWYLRWIWLRALPALLELESNTSLPGKRRAQKGIEIVRKAYQELATNLPEHG